MTEAELQALVNAPPMRGTYGPTLPAVRLPAGDIRLTQPLVFTGRYSPALLGDSMHGTRLLWAGPPDRYPVEFRGCDRPRLADLTIKFEQRGAGGVLVCNDTASRVTNTAALIQRVLVDAPNWANVKLGFDLDNTGGGVQPDQNGEYHTIRECATNGVYCGVRIGRTQAHRCVVSDSTFAAGYFGVHAGACGSQTIERCSFANVTRCVTLGDQYGGPAVVRGINAEGCAQLVRFWATVGAATLEDVRCDGMRPLPPGPGRTDGDGSDQSYFTAAIMVGMGGVVRIRRVYLGLAAGHPNPIRVESTRDSLDATDVQFWRSEGDPAPDWWARWGKPRRFEFCLSGTVMKDGSQPVAAFNYHL